MNITYNEAIFCALVSYSSRELNMVFIPVLWVNECFSGAKKFLFSLRILSYRGWIGTFPPR